MSDDLTSFGFVDEMKPLYCRICGNRITKTIGCVLSGTPIKYGVCRKYSHGASIVRT